MFNSYKLSKLLPDKVYLKHYYKERMGKELNLTSPKTFNEKLQWLKLYDRNPDYINMVDKIEAKKYVASIIGDEYVIPTIAEWDNVEDISLEQLPNEFVLKCTHDSGGVIICKDKNNFDFESAKIELRNRMSINYFYIGREWPYKNIKPRILAEPLLKDGNNDDLADYKLMCFGGKVKTTFVCTERQSSEGLKVTFFDNSWTKLPFERHYKSSRNTIQRPKSFDLMIELAEKLSKGIPFVRVDFYEINESPYFGEMTFYPGGGFEEFRPEEYDEVLGEWIDLPDKKTHNP